MATAAEGTRPAVNFPHNLPITFEQTCFGFKLSELFGGSISGVGSYLSLFDKGYPHAEAALLSCIGDGMGKRSVALIATIVITVVVLPIFCALGLLYNVLVGSIKAGFGFMNFLAQKRIEERSGDEAEASRYEQLFQEATQHFCLVGLDLAGEFTALTFLFAGAFAFDGASVKARFHEVETDILDGSAYNKMVEWGHDLQRAFSSSPTEATVHVHP